MTKFTPGPWEIVPEEYGTEGEGSYTEPRIFAPNAGPAGRTVFVATIRIGIPESEANGILLCAAPDLLQSLKEMLEGFDDGVFVRNPDGDRSSDWAIKFLPYLMAIKKAQEVISRIEGASTR